MSYRVYPPALLVLAFHSAAWAEQPGIQTSNSAQFIQQRALDPIKAQTGLPTSASRLYSKHELQVELTHNNVFMGGQIGDELLALDGESSQLNLRYRHRINTCWQFNADGAWLTHTEGYFDEPLDSWHKLFGLPDAMRDEWPVDQLQYEYEVAGENQSLRTEYSGAGDIQLQLQRYLGCNNESALLRAGLKLPIGEPANFSGNGSVDAFIDWQSPWYRSKRYSRLQWAASAGALLTTNSQLLPNQRSLIGFGAFGLNIDLTTRTRAVVQLDWHTPMFHSQLRELGKPSAQLSVGFRFHVSPRNTLELSFAEDVAIDTAPDIVARFSWHRHIGR